MTQSLLIHLNKHNIYNLLTALDYQKITLPSIIPFLGLKPAIMETDSEIRCNCGWKGEALNARKHYLEVEGCAELELYCPTCHQYLCFIAEPIFATS